MKSLKLIGLSLLSVFALSMLIAATALAEEGFLTGGTGTPTTATILGAESILETSSKAQIRCKEFDDTGIKFKSDKAATATVHWLGCQALGFTGNTKGDKAGEVLVPVEFLVCLDPKNAVGTLLDEFGIAAAIVGTAVIEVPTLGTKLELKGTILGAVLTKGTAKLFIVEFLGSAGEQTAKSCLQGTKTIEHSLLISTNGGAFELASKNIQGGLVQFEKETELMDS